MRMFFKNLFFKPKMGDVYRHYYNSPWTENAWVVNEVKDGWVRLVRFDGTEVQTYQLYYFYSIFKKLKDWSHK